MINKMKILQSCKKLLLAISIGLYLTGANSQEVENHKVEHCFITIKTNQTDLMVDALTLKSFNLHKVDKTSTGFRSLLNYGTYPTISITYMKSGGKVLFFEKNEDAQKVYDKAVNDLQKCKTLIVL